MTADELANAIGAEVLGNGSVLVTSCATLANAEVGQLSFLSNPRYAKEVETTRASAVIVAQSVKASKPVLLRAADPYYAFMQAIVLLHGHRTHPFAGIHPKAHVDPTASVGENTTIYPGAYIGPHVKIGRDCIIYANACVYDHCVIGDRVILHANTVIGADGYGYATHNGIHHKIPQIGNVILEDDVEVGACCSIERGALESTVIGTGTKIDQLVVVGHGSKIGAHCLLVAQTGIAGSVTLGHHVVLAGQTGVAGHLKIGDMVTAAAKSGIIADVEANKTVVGQPAMEASHARRVYIYFTQLPELVDRIKTLEQQVSELSSGDEDGAEVV